MEARALKSSFLLSQMPHSQPFQNDDVWCTVAPDDFPVEDLLNLDFPEKTGPSLSQEAADEGRQLPIKETSNHSSPTFSGAGEIDTLSALAVPVDDLDNLEWLSQFVDDDSNSGVSLLCPAISSGNGQPQKIVPVKARSKRLRRTRTVLPSFAFSGSGKPPETRKRKRKPAFDAGPGRKCTHCQVQKTPQWRTGPLGPKTLCNACGVRHKSGRLFPEYRPAFSPSFSGELHSNSHRKVLEMRRKKDVAEPGFMGRE